MRIKTVLILENGGMTFGTVMTMMIGMTIGMTIRVLMKEKPRLRQGFR